MLPSSTEAGASLLAFTRRCENKKNYSRQCSLVVEQPCMDSSCNFLLLIIQQTIHWQKKKYEMFCNIKKYLEDCAVSNRSFLLTVNNKKEEEEVESPEAFFLGVWKHFLWWLCVCVMCFSDIRKAKLPTVTQ